MALHSCPRLQRKGQAFTSLHSSYSRLREGASARQPSSMEAILHNCLQVTLLEAGGPRPALLKPDLGGQHRGH